MRGDLMADKKQVGTITHFFPKISVAVVEVSGELKEGDRVEIEGKGGSFEQSVASMQVEHKPVEKAEAGNAVGMKVDQPVKEGAKVFLLSE
jgi:translation elongation factor EF-1alpha